MLVFKRNIFGSSRIGSKQDSINILTATLTQNYAQVLGTKYYEFSNHLGNVLTVFSDVKIAIDANSNGVVDGFRVPIRNTADYSPFGVQLDGRTVQGDFYRYGYQGSEKDDESKGGGNSYTTFFRQLDPRVGRWFTIDPVFQPWQSPYCSMDGNPVSNNDVNGDKVKVEGTFKERREIKKELKKGRQNSNVFNDLYKDLKKDKQTHVIKIGAAKGTDNEECTNCVVKGDKVGYGSKVSDVMFINFNQIDSDKFRQTMNKESEDGSDLTTSEMRSVVIGHELGHMWLALHKLDDEKDIPHIPSTIPNPKPSYKDKGLEIKNPLYSAAKNRQIMLQNANNDRIKSEIEASNIENMIRSDLGVKLRLKYTMDLQLDYNSTNKEEKSFDVKKTNIDYNGKNEIHNYYGVSPIKR